MTGAWGVKQQCPSVGEKSFPGFGNIKGRQGVDLCMPTHWRFVLPVAHWHLERRKPEGL